MSHQIEVRITPTAKGYAPRAKWTHLSERDEVQLFDSKSGALAYWLQQDWVQLTEVTRRPVPLVGSRT